MARYLYRVSPTEERSLPHPSPGRIPEEEVLNDHPASPLSILSTAQLSIPPSPGALIQIHRMDKEHTSEKMLPHPMIPPSLGKAHHPFNRSSLGTTRLFRVAVLPYISTDK